MNPNRSRKSREGSLSKSSRQRNRSRSTHRKPVELAVQKPFATGATTPILSTALSPLVVYALLAGFLGALSGVMGKLAGTISQNSMSNETISIGLFSVQAHALLSPFVSQQEHVAYWTLHVVWLLKITTFLLNGLCTALMWKYFLKALGYGSTPVCSLLNTGMNCASSALLGYFLFGETVNLMWGIGAVFIGIGTMIIVHGEGL